MNFAYLMSQNNHISDLSKPNTNTQNATDPSTDSQISHHHPKNYENTHHNSPNQESQNQTEEQKNKMTPAINTTSPMTMNAGESSATNDFNNSQRQSSKTYSYTPQKIIFRSKMTVLTGSDKKITPDRTTNFESGKNITQTAQNSLPKISYQQDKNVSSFRNEELAPPTQSDERKMSLQQSELTQVSQDANSVSHVEPFHTIQLTHPEKASQSTKYEPLVKYETPANPEVEFSTPYKIQRAQMIDSVSYQQETMAEPQLNKPQNELNYSITNQNQQEVPFYGETTENKKKCITPWGIILILLGIGASILFVLVMLGVIGSQNVSALDGSAIGSQYSMIIQTVVYNKTKQTENIGNMDSQMNTRMDDNAAAIPIQVNANSSSIGQTGMGETGLSQKLPVTSVNEITFDGMRDSPVSPQTQSENVLTEENGLMTDKKEVKVEGHLSRVSQLNEY